MDVRAVRVDLAAALTGAGFRQYDTIPAAAQLPAAVVRWPDEVVYHRTGDDRAEARFVVVVAVPDNDFEQAQRDIDAVLSGSLAGPLETFESEHWTQLIVETADNVRSIAVAGGSGLACDLNLSIYQ